MTQTQMQQVESRSWPRTWTTWMNRARGTSVLARRRRKAITIGAVGLILAGALALAVTYARDDISSAPEVRKVAAVSVAVGVVVLGFVGIARPISKVTWRAWLAGRWHARGVRRHAANFSGHPSARARRRVQNKAAWAAQRQRDGRAARPEYGSSVRRRIIES